MLGTAVGLASSLNAFDVNGHQHLTSLLHTLDANSYTVSHTTLQQGPSMEVLCDNNMLLTTVKVTFSCSCLACKASAPSVDWLIL